MSGGEQIKDHATLRALAIHQAFTEKRVLILACVNMTDRPGFHLKRRKRRGRHIDIPLKDSVGGCVSAAKLCAHAEVSSSANIRFLARLKPAA